MLLETVRALKALEVDIFFEEQNIHTMSADGELMMTILASYAQEESLSASENQKWRIRKGFENGELVNLRFLFGYRISKDGIEIDDETAPIVREVFARVISGESFSAISRDLNARGSCCTLGGKWCAQRIRQMVAHEKIHRQRHAAKNAIATTIWRKSWFVTRATCRCSTQKGRTPRSLTRIPSMRHRRYYEKSAKPPGAGRIRREASLQAKSTARSAGKHISAIPAMVQWGGIAQPTCPRARRSATGKRYPKPR